MHWMLENTCIPNLEVKYQLVLYIEGFFATDSNSLPDPSTLKFLISGYTRLLKSSILPRWDVCSEGPFINISKFADMGPLLGKFCQKDRLLICQYEVSIAPISSEKSTYARNIPNL